MTNVRVEYRSVSNGDNLPTSVIVIIIEFLSTSLLRSVLRSTHGAKTSVPTNENVIRILCEEQRH